MKKAKRGSLFIMNIFYQLIYIENLQKLKSEVNNLNWTIEVANCATFVHFNILKTLLIKAFLDSVSGNNFQQ